MLNSLPIDELGNWFLKGWMGMLTLHLCLTFFTGGTAIAGHISPIYESEVSVIKFHTGINSPIGFPWWSLPSNEKNLQKLGFSMVKWQSEKIRKEQLFNNFHLLHVLHAIPFLEDQRVSYFSFISLTFHLLSFSLFNTILYYSSQVINSYNCTCILWTS